MDSHYAQLFAASAEAAADTTSSPDAPLLDEINVETVSDAPRQMWRISFPANRFQRAALLTATACAAVGCCAFFVGGWPAYSSSGSRSDSSAVTNNTEQAAAPEYSSPDSGAAPSPAAAMPDSATSTAPTPADGVAANNDAALQADDKSGTENPDQKIAPSSPARTAATIARSTSGHGARQPWRTVAMSPVAVASTPALAETIAAQPAAKQAGVDAEQPGATDSTPNSPVKVASNPVIRAAAQSNPQLRDASTGGRPLAPGSGNGGYVSLRRSNGDSDYEEKRLTQAIEAGGSNGRDLAGLYQQRALLYLNHGDSDRATPDFQKAIELYSAMIQRHDRVKEAQDGLQSSKNGLKIASKTQVF
jgi:hypothetical protein